MQKTLILELTDDQLRALDYALRHVAYGGFQKKENMDLCKQIIAQLPEPYSAAA